MKKGTDTIELDKDTAEALKARAAERGISISELLAEFAHESAPAIAETADIAELDRRWAKVLAGEPTVAHQDVVRWLETWGTPAFESWRD